MDMGEISVFGVVQPRQEAVPIIQTKCTKSNHISLIGRETCLSLVFYAQNQFIDGCLIFQEKPFPLNTKIPTFRPSRNLAFHFHEKVSEKL